MRLAPLLLAAFALQIAADEPGILTYEGTIYTEVEKIKGHHLDTDKITLDDQTEKLSTFYSIINYELPFMENRWLLNLEVRAALELNTQEYTNPVYKELYGSDEINRVTLSQASVDYYSDSFALSVGRNRLDLDWLSGSFDSAIFYGVNDWIEARAFWFINYYDFQYNYYTKYEDINDNKGIGGLYLQSGEKQKQFEWALYYYHVFDQGYLAGVKFYKELLTFGINGSYSYLGQIDESRLPKESIWRIWSDIIVDDDNTLEFGYSQTGENGLLGMLRFGAHDFSQFYLNNAIDRKDAANLYLQYNYEADRFSFECVGGITSYHDKSLIGSKLITQKMHSFEVDLNIGYALSKHTSVALGYMLLDLDEKDNLNFDQDLITLSLSLQLL
jgi:hypothetical protein